jgi:hypothetical protein
MPFGIPINNFASAFTQDIISSGNSNFQEIPFNLKQWINSGNPDSEIISTLQVNNETIDFPDTSLIMAIDGNNNILNNGDTTSSTLLKLDFVGQIDLTGSSQIVFECSIDSSVFEVCTSPIIIDNLKPKEHIFEVRAIDQSGKVDETPAQFRWIIVDETTTSIDDENDDATIDSSPPLTKITFIKDEKGTPLIEQESTLSNSIDISFTGSDDSTAIEDLTFECSIDSSVFEVCTSPIIIDNLKPKEHIFEVRAIDQSGKVDETPAQFRWIITDLAEKLKEIKMIIDDGEISSVLKNNLNVILSEIQTLIDNETPNNEHEICSNLEEFMLQITNNIDDISISDANALVEKTNSISEKIRC